MEMKFRPKDPETLVGFDNILAEYNEITGINTVFTDDYMLSWDIYVGSESTADGYEVFTIQHQNDRPVIGENVYYYTPSPWNIFRAINESGCYDKCIVYVEELGDIIPDLEDYMLEELNTNYMNWLDENTEA